MTLVDSHCHLDGEVFDGDRDDVLRRAEEAGVGTMLAIGTGSGPPDFSAAIRLSGQYPQVWSTVAIHPHDAAKVTEEHWPLLEQAARHPRVVAIGEVGLDYHYDFAPRDRQRSVFERQMRLAIELGKPIIIHTREAWGDTVAAIREVFAQSGLPGIFHCFSEGPEEVEEALALGFYLSFAGMVTYPKSQRLQEAARAVPLHRMLLETDSPYLAPVPKRGKRNEPANVRLTAEFVAGLRQIPFQELAAATTLNFHRLFPQTATDGAA